MLLSEIDSTKVCTKCLTEKPLARYATRSDSGKLHSWCYDCTRALSRLWYRKNKEHHRRYQRDYVLQKKFGLTRADYDDMFEAQGNGCAICGKTNDSGKELHVDHCHDSNRVRGLLCFRCNAAVGLLQNAPDLAVRLADYLR